MNKLFVSLHHMGLLFITIAFLFLVIHVLLGHVIIVPKLFFILYAIGGTMLIYEMYMKSTIAIMEFTGVLCALFLAYTSK
jgi:hypothetical protein